MASRRPSRFGSSAPRTATLAALLAAAAGSAAPASAQVSWNSGDGFWSNPASWMPFGVPGPLQVAYLGNLAGAQNAQVTMDQDDVIAGLSISNGAGLLNGEFYGPSWFKLVVNGDTVLSDSGQFSRIFITDTGLGLDLDTHDLTVNNVSRLQLRDANIRVQGKLSIGPEAYLTGYGTVQLSGTGTTFSNDGDLLVTPGEAVNLVQTSTGVFDMDGPTGNGMVNLNQDAALALTGQGLTDPFDGWINMGPHATVTMNLTGGWASGPGADIVVNGYESIGPAARITGTHGTLGGRLRVINELGHLIVYADATLTPTAEVFVGLDSHLEFAPGSDITVEGGEFRTVQGGHLDFNGPTRVEGGAFETAGVADADGDVDFNGATEWAGDVTIDGRAQQNGDAVVVAPTVITARLFDFSGDDEQTNWTINAPLVINTDDTRTHPMDFYEGEMTIGGAVSNRLTVNLTGLVQAAWAMSGKLNLSGSPLFFVERLAGSPVLASGWFSISDSKVEISANMTTLPWSIFDFDAPGSALRMRGETYVREGTVFNGPGTLVNGVGGAMWLYHTLSLGDVGLENYGELNLRRYGPGTQTAQATVDRFTNDDLGTLTVRLGGTIAGAEYDRLVSSGPANLAGVLRATLVDAGAGVFVPSEGDEFVILTASSVTGTFDSLDLPALPGGLDWRVRYSPGGVPSVVLEVVCYSDCNGDGARTVADFGCFQTKFVGGSMYADCNGDGALTVADFGCFQTKFVQGCP